MNNIPVDILFISLCLTAANLSQTSKITHLIVLCTQILEVYASVSIWENKQFYKEMKTINSVYTRNCTILQHTKYMVLCVRDTFLKKTFLIHYTYF